MWRRFLVSTPGGPRVADVTVETSVRKSTLAVDAALENLSADEPYVLQGQVLKRAAWFGS